VINFDDFWTDDEAGEPATDWPFPNDGRHSGEIVRVRDKEFSFMEKHGAKGRCLAIEVQIPKAKRVEALISVLWRGKIAEVCKSARVHPPAKGEDWDEQQLVGRQVVVETVLGISGKGTEYCRIDKWHPQAEPLPKVETAAAPPAASATRRTKPETAAEDDIPF
jgi:hypothetical protein